MNIITRAFAYLRSLRTRPAATTSKKAETFTLAIQVDATEAIATLEAVSARVRDLKAELDTAAIVAEIRDRFDRLDNVADQILATVHDMKDHVEGRPSMADTLNEAIARMQDNRSDVGGTA
jgi:trehalose-6-phosphate synthase